MYALLKEQCRAGVAKSVKLDWPDAGFFDELGELPLPEIVC